MRDDGNVLQELMARGETGLSSMARGQGTETSVFLNDQDAPKSGLFATMSAVETVGDIARSGLTAIGTEFLGDVKRNLNAVDDVVMKEGG